MRTDLWERIDGLGAWGWAIVGIGVFLAGALWLLSKLGWLLLPIGFALLVAVLTSPVVTALQRRRMARPVATVGVFALVMAAVVALVLLIVPPFLLQASQLVESIPDRLAGFTDAVHGFERRIAVINPAAGKVVEGFGRAMQDRSAAFAGDASEAVVSTARTVIVMSLSGLLGALLGFLVVKDLPRYAAPVRRWLSRPGRERIAGAAGHLRRTGTRFIRGQLLLGTIVGVASGIAMGLLGVPFPVPVGVISGIGELIPSVGPILAAIPAVILAWGEGGPTLALFAALALLAIQQAESYFLVPLVVGGAVEMPALAVMVVLLIAGGAFGIVGMIVAVPLVAMTRDALRWFWMDDATLTRAVAAGEQSPPRRRDAEPAEAH